MKRYHVTLYSEKLLEILEYYIEAESEKEAIRKAMMKARKLDEVNGSSYVLHKVEEIIQGGC